MAVCLLLSAYFSATETAFSSASTTRLKTLAEKGNANAALACRLLEQYDRLLSTILIGNNIVNIATASIGTVLFVHHYGDAGATISTVVVTVVVLIFGEISPKSIAKDCAERFAMFSAPILRVLIWVLLPLVCAFLRPRELLLSAVAAARGFVLAMTVAVSVGEGNALIIGAAGVPAVLSVSALLAACSMVWQGGEATGRYSLRTCRMPYFLCITLAVLSALLRAAIAALCDV